MTGPLPECWVVDCVLPRGHEGLHRGSGPKGGGRKPQPPTEKQIGLLRLIWDGQRAGRPPSERELCAATSQTTNAVRDKLRLLEGHGLLERAARGTFRGLRVTSAGVAALGVVCCPTCGRP